MKLDLTKLCATVVAAAMAASVALPAAAAPMFTPKAPEPVLEIQKVQDREWRRHRDRDWRRGNRDRDWRRGGDRRDWGKRFVRRGDGYYFNGHRGYRHHRPGYREYNGWWFPAAAFLAGAVISGAIQNQGPAYRSSGGNAHVQWCYDRYRSYRASDNTFQPYNGPRRQCYSPYS